jgi:SH3 domain
VRCQVIIAWVRTYDPALSIKADEQVSLGHEDDEWPGWIWCVPAIGPSGWLPKHKLTIYADGVTAVTTVDYDTRELTVAPGDVVTRISQELGWSQCQNANGETGWVPDSCLA